MSEINTKSYLSQVRQLRNAANAVLKKYPIEVIKLKFINHGENTTFKIISQSDFFLLRIHRKNYHSKHAIKEELEWLKQLSENADFIQKPLRSYNGLLVEEIQIGNNLDSRFCSVLTWVTGNMRHRSLNQKALFNAGQLAGYLHQNTFKQKIEHRAYWDTEGLLGMNAKFGNLHTLKPEISKSEFKALEECRLMTIKKIETYKNQKAMKFSMIHADLHFGNIIWKKNQPMPIDFDDCGHGPHMYDLAIILKSVDYLFKSPSKNAKESFIEALFEGYTSTQDLSKDDLEILPYFKLTRNLVMLGWGYDRRDNPPIFKHFKETLQKKLEHFKKALKEGPEPLY